VLRRDIVADGVNVGCGDGLARDKRQWVDARASRWSSGRVDKGVDDAKELGQPHRDNYLFF
jgi:hypothetical protein